VYQEYIVFVLVEVCMVGLRMTHGLLNLPAFCSHQYVFVVVFSSPEYLTDLQGRSVDDPGLYWDFYGSSVCGKQMLPFISLYVETSKASGRWGWRLPCFCGRGS